MRTNYLLLAGALLSGAACSSMESIDPLAPVPTKVNPHEIAAPPLRVAWSVSSTDEDGDREVPTHAAAVGERVVFVAYADRLDALDLRDGEKLWEARQSSTLAFAPVAFRGGVALASEAGWLWMDADGSASTFLELADVVNDALVVPAGLVVIGGEGVHLLTLSETNSLSVAWSLVRPGGRRVGASPTGDALYITSENGSITALQTANGERSWRSEEIEVAPLRAAVDRAVYVVDRGGRLHALRRRDGRLMWDAKDVGMRVVGSPVVSHGLVWVPGLDAAVHAFTTGGGSHQFRIPTNGRIHLDLALWGPWIIASPQYGPWILVEGPHIRVSPSDPGAARNIKVESDDDIALPPAVGEAGVVVIDNAGTIRLLTPEQGAIDLEQAPDPAIQ